MSDGPKLVVPLKRPEFPALIEHLESLLADARAGRVLALCYVVEDAEGVMGFHALHGAGSYPIKMVGELEVAKWAVMNRHCARGE